MKKPIACLLLMAVASAGLHAEEGWRPEVAKAAAMRRSEMGRGPALEWRDKSGVQRSNEIFKATLYVIGGTAFTSFALNRSKNRNIKLASDIILAAGLVVSAGGTVYGISEGVRAAPAAESERVKNLMSDFRRTVYELISDSTLPATDPSFQAIDTPMEHAFRAAFYTGVVADEPIAATLTDTCDATYAFLSDQYLKDRSAVWARPFARDFYDRKAEFMKACEAKMREKFTLVID